MLSPDAPFSYAITPHFYYGELCNYEKERRFTDQGQCLIAEELCNYLEKLRKLFGPIQITSGHRPPAINAEVGGASQSEHLFKSGEGAVDIYPISGDGYELEKYVDGDWPFSVGYGMSYRGFVHIGIRAGRPKVRWDY
jgi:hypothetical protein